MQIKKYEAVDMPSAIRMIKSELGSDAVILSTKNIRKGKGNFGLFGRSMVEVTAAVDPDHGKNNSSRFRKELFSSVRRTAQTPDLPAWIHPLKHELKELKDGMEALQLYRSDTPEVQRLAEELSSFKQLLHEAIGNNEGKGVENRSPVLRKIGDHLSQNEVDPRVVEKLLSGIENRLPEDSFATDPKAESTLRRIMQNILRVQNGIRLEGEGPKKIAFIGPTGVGKTTTIAKIAADYSLARKKKVALVTIDTYRIAAIEQLKIYAKIIGIPVDVVVHEEDLDRIFQKHRNKDLILIDTAGRSHRDISQLKELRRVFAGRQDIERHLVLSATTKQSDISSILRNFKSIDFHYLLFTKIDEGSRFGTILNAALESGKYISYMTNGQRVPEDIREARVEDIMDLILAANSGWNTA